MKKLFTSLVTLVLSCLLAAPAFADEQSVTEVGGIVTAPVAGKYYVIQGNGQAGQVSWLYDNNGTFAATASTEVPTGPEGIPYVWTFEITNDGYAAKNYTTGRYIHIAGTTNGGAVQMQDAASYFTIESDGDYVAFKNAYGQYVDMGYSGTSPCTWADGVTGSRRLNLREATVQTVTELDIAIGRLNTCFNTYGDYHPELGTKTIDRGTDIGQYNCTDEQYNFFYNNLLSAYDILSETQTATVEEIYTIIENIETGFEAIMATLVPLTIADGNYRIVSAMTWTQTDRVDTGQLDENDQPIYEETTTHPTKAMYATLGGHAKWATLDETDCLYLWKLTNNAETGFIQMMNIATDGILATCSTSTQATLATDSQTEMDFRYIGRTKDNKLVVTMKPSTGGDYAFLHCGGHSSGSGKSGDIVGWAIDADASHWILVPVSDEEVATLINSYDPIKKHELLVSKFNETIAETEEAIAKAQDDTYCITRSEGLITDTLQFTSPWTDSTEGSFAYVLNDDANSYWHSSWQDGAVAAHTHYFNVAFTEPIEGDIQCFMRRRNSYYDHITALGVFASNEESALTSTTDAGWTNIGTFDLSANAAATKTVYSNILNLTQGYQYFRFYIDGTISNQGFGHFATFQLYNATINGNTQWSQMGDAATAISTALATAKAVDIDEVEESDYEALKNALDAFMEVYVDPSPLAEAIEANKDVASAIVIGENPGFWSEDSGADTFINTMAEAKAYLLSGAYTQSQTDAYTEAITSGVADLMAAANPIEEGKWYAFKYDSRKNFNAHQWNTAGAINATLGDLFDNYAAPANVVTDGEGEDAETYLEAFSNLDDVMVGQGVRFINEDLIQRMDQVAFRFVAQGDSAYVLQHKSGLYLNGTTRSTMLTLGLAPAIFNVEAVGYGKVAIKARTLKGEGYYTEPVYLHAANAGHSLVTWNSNAVNSSSALYIEPIDDGDLEEGEDAMESAIMNVKPNSMVFMCYPAGFSVSGADIYAYQGAISDEDKAHFGFNKVEQAEPGQPVLLVVGDIADFETDDEEEEPEPIEISIVSTSFAKEPLTTGGIHGTYAYEWVDEGTVVVGGGKIAKPGNMLVLAEGEDATDCTRDISGNTGYIVYGENILTDASVDDFDLVFTTDKPALAPAIQGDLNGDGAVDISDAVAVLDVMAAGTNDPAADFNGDGSVDISDFVCVLDFMAQQ